MSSWGGCHGVSYFRSPGCIDVTLGDMVWNWDTNRNGEPSGKNVWRYDEICILCSISRRSEIWKSYLKYFFLRNAFLFSKHLGFWSWNSSFSGALVTHKPWGLAPPPRRQRDSWHVSCCCVSGSSAAAVCCRFSARCWWPRCPPISDPLTPPPCAALRSWVKCCFCPGKHWEELMILNTSSQEHTFLFVLFRFFGDLHCPTVA